jgi:hypothetical protein
VTHRITGLPVTHDVTRFKTLGVWLLTSLLAGAAVWRLTGRRGLGAVALLFSFFHLERLAMEPGHPQGLCVLLLAACVLVVTFWEEGRSTFWCASLLGILAGTVCVTKPNVGLFLAAAVLLAVCLSGRQRGWNRWLSLAIQAAVLLLPTLLMREVLFDRGGIVLAGVVTISTLAMITAARSWLEPAASPSNAIWPFLAGCSMAMCGWAAATLAHGTTMAGLLDGLVLQHAGFGATFFGGSPIHWSALPWAAAALWMAIAASRGHVASAVVARSLLAVAVTIVGVLHLVETFTPLSHGLQNRGGALFLIGLATPLVWALLAPVPGISRRDDGPERFARLALCLFAVLQPLGIFPTPGTQAAIGSLGIVLVGLVAASDLMRQRVTAAAPALPWRRVATGLLLLGVLTISSRDIFLWRYRQSLEPLALPGAARLRLPQAEVARHRWLTAVLKQHADTFLFRFNGMNSYYFWTGSRPPTALNATCWPVLFDQSQQHRILAAVQDRPRLCVVCVPHQWPVLDHAPLVRFMQEQFEPISKHNGIEVWVRKPLPRSAS